MSTTVTEKLGSTILIPTILAVTKGFYGLIGGIVALVEGFKGGPKWGPIVLGVLSLIFGVLLLFNPFMGAALLPLVVGIFAVIGGIAAIILAFQMR